MSCYNNPRTPSPTPALTDWTGTPPPPDWGFSMDLPLGPKRRRAFCRVVAVQARLSPLFRLPGAPVRGSSRLATPTMRLPVFASSPVCAHRSSALDLPMPLLPLRRYSTSTATAYWRSRSPKLPTQIGTLHRRCAHLSPTGTREAARINLSQTPHRAPSQTDHSSACCRIACRPSHGARREVFIVM